MTRRRKWHSVRRDGAGRTRIKLAEMLLRDCGITVHPDDIVQNIAPSARWLDLCRWCADGTKEGGEFVHVCSWSRMGDIVRSGKIAVVDDDHLGFEVCES